MRNSGRTGRCGTCSPLIWSVLALVGIKSGHCRPNEARKFSPSGLATVERELDYGCGGSMPYLITDICIGCGVCADNCAADAIRQEDIKYVIDWEVCTECGKCRDSCTKKAVIYQE